ncbi:hypothetical protein HGB07_08370, partial [Candidatus Roizmanbacteria bacterium]|nr:hypothetical protein [Candidatus Roizmanbacteria bacterium]
MITSSAYVNSTIVQKVKNGIESGRAPKIAFLDIDSTMIGLREDTNAVRFLLEKMGYCVCFVTSRTEEMIMSQNEYTISRRLFRFYRPPPHLAHDVQHKHYYIDPAEFEPAGLLDADVIAGSTGTSILVKQEGGGYQPDRDYQKRLRADRRIWHAETIADIESIDKDKLTELHPNEYKHNYDDGITNIFPPPFRIQLLFKAEQEKKRFALLAQIYQENHVTNFHLIDDSKPELDRYVF